MMRQQRAESWRARVYELRLMFILGFFSLCSYIAALWLLLTARHPGRVDFSREVGVALALVNLGGTFHIAALATLPAPPGRTIVPAGSSVRHLPRVVAWGVVILMLIEGGQMWSTLHNDFDRAVAFGLVALALNFVGQMGAIALRIHQTTVPPSDAPTAQSIGS